MGHTDCKGPYLVRYSVQRYIMAVLPSCLLASLLLSYLPVSVYAHKVNITKKNTTYTCSMTGDPHLHTFLGNKVSVPGLCAYTLVKLRNYESSTLTVPMSFDVGVYASNEVVPETGQYYVSKTRVDVHFTTTVNGTTAGVAYGIHTTSSEMIQAFLNKGSPLNESVWEVQLYGSMAMPATLRLNYDANLGLAKISVVIPGSKEGVNLTFRPVDRQRAAAGKHQAMAAGLTIEVKGDLIHDTEAFPKTMCSSTSDLTRTPKEYARDITLQEHAVGIYAIDLQLTSQKISSRQYECGRMIIQACSDLPMAVQTCSPLLTEPAMVTCLEKSTTAFLAYDRCFKYMCDGDHSACTELQNYVDGCPGHLAPFNCKHNG